MNNVKEESMSASELNGSLVAARLLGDTAQRLAQLKAETGKVACRASAPLPTVPPCEVTHHLIDSALRWN
jgi:hypothetical protein